MHRCSVQDLTQNVRSAYAQRKHPPGSYWREALAGVCWLSFTPSVSRGQVRVQIETCVAADGGYLAVPYGGRKFTARTLPGMARLPILEIVLVRHAEAVPIGTPPWDVDDDGRPLSEVGLRDADELAFELDAYSFHAAYSSPSRPPPRGIHWRCSLSTTCASGG